ncbi:MAG TPA: DUF6048 family protein [Chryseosolibacter sp.]
MKLLSSIALICFALAGFAQPRDSAVLQLDTVKNRFLPTGIRIGTDVIAIVKSNIQDDFTGWEVNADVDFNRYYLNFDYGTWGRNFATDSAAYKNDGTYWRVGVDVNFLLKDIDRNLFFIGLRYGRASYNEQMLIVSDDDIWGVYSNSYINPAATARWLELTSGIKVKIYKFIWLGYTVRFKFGLKGKGQDQMISHDIPGYGRTDKETAWGFNYQLMFRIPFRPLPPLPPQKKK